jgi:hypothetical protein
MVISPRLVIPALRLPAGRALRINFGQSPKAGIHHLPMKFIPPVMDPRLRGGDEW